MEVFCSSQMELCKEGRLACSVASPSSGIQPFLRRKICRLSIEQIGSATFCTSTISIPSSSSPSKGSALKPRQVVRSPLEEYFLELGYGESDRQEDYIPLDEIYTFYGKRMTEQELVVYCRERGKRLAEKCRAMSRFCQHNNINVLEDYDEYKRTMKSGFDGRNFPVDVGLLEIDDDGFLEIASGMPTSKTIVVSTKAAAMVYMGSAYCPFSS